jgi:UDP-3-O-[3-hydroxymyristoyl] glucosamine N-acyltransferase
MKLKDIAKMTKCEVFGDGEAEIFRLKALEEAREGDIAVFIAREGGERIIINSRASAIFSNVLIEGKNTIIPKEDFSYSLKELRKLFAIKEIFNKKIHRTVILGRKVKIGSNVSIGAYSVIGDKVEIGDGTRIFPLVVVYPGVKIGKNCTIHSGVVIRGGVEIGDNVEIDANAVIGSSGFQRGFKKDSLEMPPLCGEVKIGKRVFIGALSNVTKSTLKDTRIDNGTKIDGLVYIGPSAKIGKYCRIAGQTGISEGVIIEDEVSIGGQCGLADAVKVGKKAFIASKSGVLKDVEEHSYVVGIPAMDVKIWKKIQVILRNLPKIWERIRK